jgi:hypothetical protein
MQIVNFQQHVPLQHETTNNDIIKLLFFANFVAALPVLSDKNDFHGNINQIGME